MERHDFLTFPGILLSDAPGARAAGRVHDRDHRAVPRAWTTDVAPEAFAHGLEDGRAGRRHFPENRKTIDGGWTCG